MRMPGTCGRLARRDALSTGLAGSMTERGNLSVVIGRWNPPQKTVCFDLYSRYQGSAFDDDLDAVGQACAAHSARGWRLGEESRVDLVHVGRFEHAVHQHVHLHHAVERRSRGLEDQLEVLQDPLSLT